MADPGEAPIVHGEIRATTKWKVNGDEITAIDTALDANSTNPLTNAATSAAISAITAPAGASFYVHMVMNPSAQHNAGDAIQFASVETNINTFLDGNGDAIGGPGTPSAPRTTITVPAKGTYFISTVTTALDQSNSLGIQIKKNTSNVKTQTGTGVITSAGTFLLEAGDSMSLASTTNAAARSELSVTLLKEDHTL